jgi:hypothetical protein
MRYWVPIGIGFLSGVVGDLLAARMGYASLRCWQHWAIQLASFVVVTGGILLVVVFYK